MSTDYADSDNENDEPYAEGTALTALLGDGPKVKILAAFLAEPDFDLNVTEVANMAGVSRNTVYRHIDDLTELGVVIKTRETGGSPRYKINKDNVAAKKLAELEWELIDLVFDD
ncbi:winged helix-turn-helix domain-containing protein (plasmid) [Haloferax sp. S1W]|uniref:winged helix-turn-helix domain-containing protein n=1 Tax=Haloferax sp. S1W TaxID=3377110 RepID=UPI0037C77D2F